MGARDYSPHPPNCHRCDDLMVLHSQEIVSGQTMNIFRCARCNIFEANEAENPHNWTAAKKPVPREGIDDGHKGAFGNRH
jgi:hypothetical protein